MYVHWLYQAPTETCESVLLVLQHGVLHFRHSLKVIRHVSEWAVLIEVTHFPDQQDQIHLCEEHGSLGALLLQFLRVSLVEHPLIDVHPSSDLVCDHSVVLCIFQDTVDRDVQLHGRLQPVTEERCLHIGSILNHIAVHAPAVINVAEEQLQAVKQLLLCVAGVFRISVTFSIWATQAPFMITGLQSGDSFPMHRTSSTAPCACRLADPTGLAGTECDGYPSNRSLRSQLEPRQCPEASARSAESEHPNA